MSLPENDSVRLRHMLDVAEQALRFCAGRCREAWQSVNEKLPPLVQEFQTALTAG